MNTMTLTTAGNTEFKLCYQIPKVPCLICGERFDKAFPDEMFICSPCAIQRLLPELCRKWMRVGIAAWCGDL